MTSKPTQSIVVADDILEKYPKHRKTLRNLAMCLDFLVRRQDHSHSDNGKSSKRSANTLLFTAALHSIPDDRFDIVTLEPHHTNLKGSSTGEPSTTRLKKDRANRR